MLIGIQSLYLAFIASVKMLAIEKINGGYTSFSHWWLRVNYVAYPNFIIFLIPFSKNIYCLRLWEIMKIQMAKETNQEIKFR